MGYVRTAGMSTAARRRRRRTALVMTALVVLLLGVFAYAGAYYKGWIKPGVQDDVRQTTAAPPTVALQPSDVTVNVYNASGKPGIAGRTAKTLQAKGFSVASVDNDPEKATVPGVADIRYGPEGKDAAKLLRKQVRGSKLVPDKRETKTVDLVIGDAFKELATPSTTASPTKTGGG